MIINTNNAPRGGVQPKSIRKLIFLSILALFFGAISSLQDTYPVFAETQCSYNAYSNGQYININWDNNIQYPDGTDMSTVSYDPETYTLTLNNYNGAPICSNQHLLIISLEGNNTIDYTNTDVYGSSYANIFAYGNLIFKGDGELTVSHTAQDNNAKLLETYDALIVDGPKINLLERSSNDCYNNTGAFFMKSGEVHTNCRTYVDDIFSQTGGILDIDASLATFPSMSAGIVYIAGGETRIKHNTGLNITDSVGLYIRPYGNMEYYLNDYYDSEDFRVDGDIAYYRGWESSLPADYEIPMSSQYLVYFAGGNFNIDTKIPLVIGTDVSDKDFDFDDFGVNSLDALKQYLENDALKIADNMLINPEDTSLKTIDLRSYIGGDEIHTLFVPDDVDIETALAAMDFSFIPGTMHIYEPNGDEPAVPGTDGATDAAEESEENPNTADFRLFSIISAVVVSIIAEAFIIFDLKKRLTTIQSEATTNNSNEPNKE